MSTPATAATLKEHLEDIVWVHAPHTARTTSLVNLLQVHSLIVLLFFLWITQNGIRFTYVLELPFCLLHGLLTSLLMLIRVPLHSHNSIGFLDLRFACVFRNFKYLVIVFSFRLFELDLSVLYLFSNAWCLRCQLFNLCKLLNRLLILFLRQIDITSLHIHFDIVFVHVYCFAKHIQRVVVPAHFRKSTS